jgi:hypothetical protein
MNLQVFSRNVKRGYAFGSGRDSVRIKRSPCLVDDAAQLYFHFARGETGCHCGGKVAMWAKKAASMNDAAF